MAQNAFDAGYPQAEVAVQQSLTKNAAGPNHHTLI
jgi:hypothetical protein